jgi:hypothetical protein
MKIKLTPAVFNREETFDGRVIWSEKQGVMFVDDDEKSIAQTGDNRLYKLTGLYEEFPESSATDKDIMKVTMMQYDDFSEITIYLKKIPEDNAWYLQGW